MRMGDVSSGVAQPLSSAIGPFLSHVLSLEPTADRNAACKPLVMRSEVDSAPEAVAEAQVDEAAVSPSVSGASASPAPSIR